MVKVPEKVLQELEMIRTSGAINMLDTFAVIRCADQLGMQNAAAWVRNNRTLYWDGIFAGFEAE
ncbi:DUF5049 domain-containing protein [Paenibacillus sp. S150]|uniref:DUF5049 domain-containing protein n=1 Tax=Paenibacillus sp. S150 TaxID=2749826 RepID=UPI001C588CA2|nr:DUF5049 domain-containing protein [Paenibacillus sp. S150]MBW4081300.1 DUF5049 domain-containing protein [Paenibacillus sp. S150]